MVCLMGLEPMTPWLKVRCSMPTELQAHIRFTGFGVQLSRVSITWYSLFYPYPSFKPQERTCDSSKSMVGLERFELSYDRYERSVLPLDDSPIRKERGIVSRMAMPDHYDIGFPKGSRTPILCFKGKRPTIRRWGNKLWLIFSITINIII